VNYKPRITSSKFVAPGRALALWLLRHIAEPQHRLVLIDIVYRRAAQAYEFLEISSKPRLGAYFSSIPEAGYHAAAGSRVYQHYLWIHRRRAIESENIHENKPLRVGWSARSRGPAGVSYLTSNPHLTHI
jgi:hypothetical protein